MQRSLTVAVLLGLTAVPARAHKYLDANPTGETWIPEIAVSRVVYRVLPVGGLHRYGFRASAGQEIFIQLLGPDNGPDILFQPAFALVAMGHGLDSRTVTPRMGRLLDPTRHRERLGAADADGVLVIGPEDTDFELFHEPFTGTDYRMRQTLSLAAPAGGTYRIIVFDPARKQGRYVLATGRSERFGVRDILRFPEVWLRVRRFMGKSTAPLWIAVGLLVAAGLCGVTWAVLRVAR